MKTLYYGGQKSGKSSLAEAKALELADQNRPVYIATYDDSYGDAEMAERIARHRVERAERFVSVEEPRDLIGQIASGGTYLIDCMSMWLLNTLEWDEERMLAQIEALGAVDAHIVFVLNDVGSGVIPAERLSRTYVDRSGIVGQALARVCDEVYEVKLGIGVRLK